MMKNIATLHKYVAAVALGASMFLGAAASAQPAPLDAGLATIQHAWEQIQYQTPEKAREEKFAALAKDAHQLTEQFPQRAEPHIWEGIVLSSWAGAKGGLGALSIVKQAKAEYETAIQMDANALNGSALNSLGVLYYKVPGWPVGFGDNDKAESLLKQALAVNPTGIDPNYFYADFLIARKRNAEALPYLDNALKAPPRPGREVSDTGRREEVQKLKAQVQAAR